MTLFNELMGKTFAVAPPESDYWYSDTPIRTNADVNVTPEKALNVGAVFAAVRVIAETVAMLPVITYTDRGKDHRERAADDPVYELLHDQPNPWQTAYDFKEMMTGHCALRGNGYAHIQDDGKYPTALIPLHPDRMLVEQLMNWKLRYRYTWGDGTQQTFNSDEIFHVRGLSLGGLTGVSVIKYARETIGLALASEGFAGRMFANDARPPLALKHPGKLDPKSAKRIARSWQESHGGWRQAGKVAVLEEGMDVVQIGMTGEDTKYIESRAFSVTEIARWFRMPPHLLQDLTRSTNNNIEHQGLEFITYTMAPWFKRWEGAIRRDLLPDKKMFAEFLIDALLRTDTKSRYESYRTGITSGFLTIDEVRIAENKEPFGPPYDRPTPAKAGETGADPGGDSGDKSKGTQKKPLKPTEKAAARSRAIVAATAERVVRKEQAAVQKVAGKIADEEWPIWVSEFYSKHVDFVAETLALSRNTAAQYCMVTSQKVETDRGVTKPREQVDFLIRLALEDEEEAVA